MRADKVVFSMHKKEWPVTRLRNHAVPRNRLGLRAGWMLLLGAIALCVPAMAAPAKGAKPADTQTKQTTPAEFVGADVCATCHEAQSKNFAFNPHTRLAQKHDGSAVTCEDCHGAGKAHVDGGGDKSKIFSPKEASAKDVDAKCLSCHAGTHPNFERSPHGKGNVSCVSCHSIHDSKAPEHLLKASQPELCYQCHTDVKPSFDMPFHHRVNEGLVTCSDCHNVHGTFQANNVRTTADQNAVCTKCHTETRGPFVFEHAPVRAEGCMSCHTPHGSQNARLLNMPSIATLCNQCHSPVAAGTVHGMDAGSSTITPCINCHTMIHGSNISQAFIR